MPGCRKWAGGWEAKGEAMDSDGLMVGDVVRWSAGHEEAWTGQVCNLHSILGALPGGRGAREGSVEDGSGEWAVVRFGGDEFMVCVKELELVRRPVSREEVKVTKCPPGAAQGALDGPLTERLVGCLRGNVMRTRYC